MLTFGKGRRLGDTKLHEEISEKLDRPSEFSEAAKKRIKELRVDAKKLEVTFATEGWIDIIQPLIDSEANPHKIHELFKSGKSDKEIGMALGKSEGFFNLDMILKNVVGTLSVPIEEEKEKEESK